ncbi:MAG: lactate racemase domain-containing protein, partial [Candidatus Thorarchaeota archaeon]
HGRVKPEAVQGKVLKELYEEWKDNVITHDADSGNRLVGETSRGTPILIDEQVLDSCLVIVLSDSEYHYFAGQAGTVKLFCPGIAGRETIRVNHPRMFDLEKGFVDGCRLGNTVGNPVIEDMIEIVQKMQQRLNIFCIDTIIDRGKIVYVQAGDIIACHKAAAPLLRRLRVVDVDEPADIVVVSVGELGINLYQAGKGIHAAWNAVRHDRKGWIILLARCEDGIGSAAFEEAMMATKDMSVKDALKYVIQTYCSQKTFKIGNQKPPDLFRILLDVAEGDVKVLTELDPKTLRSVYRLEGVSPNVPGGPQAALRGLFERWVKEHPDNPDPLIYVLGDSGLLVNVKKR